MKLIKWLDTNMEKYIMFVLLVGMSLTMGVQIIARYLFNNSLTWSEELTRFMFIWSVFISISYCLKTGISLKIDTLVSLFPKKVQIIFNIVIDGILAVFFIYMIPMAYQFAYSSVANGQRSPACRIPMYFVQGALLVGFFLAVLRAIQGIYQSIRQI